MGDRPAGHGHVCGGSVMTMNGVPVPAEGLDHIKALEKWLEQYPNDVTVRSKLADLQARSPLCRAGRTRRHHAPGPGALRVPGPARTEEVHRRGAHHRRRQCAHHGRVRSRHLQPPGRRGHRRAEQGQRPASLGPLLCRRLRERVEEELGLPRDHAGSRRSGRTGPRPVQ